VTDEFRKASAQLGEALSFLTLLRHTVKEDEFDPQADTMFASAVLVAVQVPRNAIWDAHDALARVSDGVVVLPHRHHEEGDHQTSAHEAVLVLCEWCTKWQGPGYPPDLLASELNLSRLAALLERERAKLDATPQPVATPPVATTTYPWTDNDLDELSPTPRKLLRAMLGHDRRELADLADAVWDGVDGDPHGAIHDANKFLERLGYTRRLSKVSKEPAVRWKDAG
jgi:hypothetical protein